MKILVINLPKDESRRSWMDGQLQRLGLDYEIVPGVLGKALSPAELAVSYDSRKAMRILCRDLAPAQIGNSLSHIAAYRKVVDGHIDCALILEDDAVLPDDLPEVIGLVEKCLRSSDPMLILLSPAEVASGPVTVLSDRHAMAPFKAGYFGHSYLVTYAAARALLKFLYPVGDVTDCWKRLVRHRVVDIRVVTPALVEQDQAKFGSSSTSDILRVGIHKNAVKKATYKFRRAFWLTCDWFLSQYHRRVKPYAGTLRSGS